MVREQEPLAFADLQMQPAFIERLKSVDGKAFETVLSQDGLCDIQRIRKRVVVLEAKLIQFGIHLAQPGCHCGYFRVAVRAESHINFLLGCRPSLRSSRRQHWPSNHQWPLPACGSFREHGRGAPRCEWRGQANL